MVEAPEAPQTPFIHPDPLYSPGPPLRTLDPLFAPHTWGVGGVLGQKSPQEPSPSRTIPVPIRPTVWISIQNKQTNTNIGLYVLDCQKVGIEVRKYQSSQN